jgi:tripartite-type tricarboxylate transporter receptor subunit TctC
MGAKQVVAAMAAAGASLAFVPAKADPVADFYKGKQISWVLSAGEGGGYSSYARAFAPFLSAHIPGNPKVVIQNMPGAGGIRAMNYLFSVAPKDGTVIALVHSSVPFAPLYGLQGASFDPRKMNWIGSMNATTAICVAWHTSGIKDWRDMMSKEYLVGGTGAGSQMETMPAMLNHLFGTKMKVISGYKGGNDVYLAMERGEVAGRCGGLYSSISSTRPDWFPQKKVAVPIQVAVERNPHFPDVPAVAEFAKDEQTKNVLKLILSPLQMDRPILLPPGAPAERVEALRRAFHDAINDPAFIAEAAKQRIEIEEVAGDKVARIVEDAFAMPPEVIKAAKESMSLTGGATE